MARHLLKIEWDLRAENQLLQSERLPTEIILQAFEAWYSANKFLTHSRDDYLAEFLEAWQTVKIPSDGALRRIWAISQSAYTPRVALEYFKDEKMRLLVTFCRELQRTRGDAPFFLSCRTVQQLFGLSSPRETHRRLSRNFHFELPLHPKTYASYPVVSTANSSGLFEVVVRHISAVLRSRCAGFACPACLAADTYPARPLLST